MDRILWKEHWTKYWNEYNDYIFFSLFLVVDFFNRINLIYGTISEYCDSASCPTMSGGARFEYLWADGEKYKKPTALPAPQYVTLLMDWIEAQINNETVFPVSTGSWHLLYNVFNIESYLYQDL